jgi:hypothetical protein
VFVLGAELNAFLHEPARSPTAVVATRSKDQPSEAAARPSLAGRLVGFVGLLMAALLLRKQVSQPRERTPA